MGTSSNDPHAISNVYRKIDDMQDKISKIINQSMLEGPQIYEVPSDNKTEILMLEERLKQADIMLKYQEDKGIRTYHLISRWEMNLDMDFEITEDEEYFEELKYHQRPKTR